MMIILLFLNVFRVKRLEFIKKKDTDNYELFCSFGFSDIYLFGRKGCLGAYISYYKGPSVT